MNKDQVKGKAKEVGSKMREAGKLVGIGKQARPEKQAKLLESLSQECRAIAGHRYRLLDLGCGPGRDLKAFTAMGHEAIGVDGSARFVAMARAYSGCEVWQQDFVQLDLPARYLTASTPTLRYSMCRARRCRRCCATCMRR
jgi:SAM-dependent methyltransferase